MPFPSVPNHLGAPLSPSLPAHLGPSARISPGVGWAMKRGPLSDPEGQRPICL